MLNLGTNAKNHIISDFQIGHAKLSQVYVNTDIKWFIIQSLNF